MLKKLKESRAKDFQRKSTSFGPHKDDFEVKINDMNVRNYGSQGQQRSALLSLKLRVLSKYLRSIEASTIL